ncbi:hypothetical protein M409DRAFT_31105 [Zasmidium cellare ATCC 36951]|uniref:ABM domain-containing protein n=1 Tax=Zasmidium cellare ATCC 36951 TaxID=1080233 RepID=A0A6A6BWN9_ZASCE|nr:uncharacterized protein M409DRAFT_31105 [Zasmidium cellare ATCC 36951]KAF2158380.1 hypothetical protein M409DRAFT_31105 [Zasmidium cellare ATCC 36951]
MLAKPDISLFCYLYPGSPEKQKRIIHLLETCYDYRDPASETKTWCYFTRATRPGARNQIVDALECAHPEHVIAGFEVYACKPALSRQLNHPEFKRYHRTATDEGLYAQPEDMHAWYPTVGFLARGAVAGPGAVVITGLITVKEDDAAKDSALVILRSFSEWVEREEPGCLTYCVFTRPKAPGEILLFERYADVASVEAHMRSSKFAIVMKTLRPLTKSMAMNEWAELPTSFTGNVVGGGETGSPRL